MNLLLSCFSLSLYHFLGICEGSLCSSLKRCTLFLQVGGEERCPLHVCCHSISMCVVTQCQVMIQKAWRAWPWTIVDNMIVMFPCMFKDLCCRFRKSVPNSPYISMGNQNFLSSLPILLSFLFSFLNMLLNLFLSLI